MKKRNIIITLTIIIVLLLTTLVKINASDYKVLNQGRTPTCLPSAVNTYIDIVGEPCDLDPYTIYREFGGPQSPHKLLDYYIEKGVIVSWKYIPRSEIEEQLKKSPVMVVILFNRSDWWDGIIEGSETHKGKHAAVLISKGSDYYLGVNSWGVNWGFDGHFRLYDINVVNVAYVLELPIPQIYR